MPHNEAGDNVNSNAKQEYGGLSGGDIGTGALLEKETALLPLLLGYKFSREEQI